MRYEQASNSPGYVAEQRFPERFSGTGMRYNSLNPEDQSHHLTYGYLPPYHLIVRYI